MIDLHNHLLPGVDDGAADLAESLAMARDFVAEGVSAAVVTPHLDPMRGNGVGREVVEALLTHVQREIDQQAVPLQLLPGNELLLTPDAPRLLAESKVATLAGTHYVLVEVPLATEQRPLYLEDTLFRLQAAGYHPILAHPERYAFLDREGDLIDRLLCSGVAFQLTAPALLGEYGQRVERRARRLLARGAYVLASSDRHHPGTTRSLADLAQRVAQLSDEATAALLLQENPARVLRDEALVTATPVPIRAPWFAPWRRG